VTPCGTGWIPVVIDQYVSPNELRRLISTLLVTVVRSPFSGSSRSLSFLGCAMPTNPGIAAVTAPQGETGWLIDRVSPERGYELRRWIRRP